jgi:hypothetical protein
MYFSSAIAGFDERNNDKMSTFAKRLNTMVDDVRAFAHRMKTADQPFDAVRANGRTIADTLPDRGPDPTGTSYPVPPVSGQ